MTVCPKIVSPQSGTPLRLSCDNAGIEFADVSFEYQPGQPILQKLSFSVSPGQSVAIVGGLSSIETEIGKSRLCSGSGSGKSTITRLLYRFFEPSEGNIRVGQLNISSLDVDTLR